MPGNPFSQAPDNNGPREPSFKMSTAQLGAIILFIAIGVLFAATLVAYVIARLNAPSWRATGARDLPGGLFASTLLLLGVSWTMQWALNAIRANKHTTMHRALLLAGAFGAAFLFGQAFNWIGVARAEVHEGTPTLFAFTFYLLTGLHAVHVLGGFVPLGVVLHRTAQREYSSSRHEGVKLCVQYWHLLGIIWLLLLATMYVAT